MKCNGRSVQIVCMQGGRVVCVCVCVCVCVHVCVQRAPSMLSSKFCVCLIGKVHMVTWSSTQTSRMKE